MLRTTGFYEKMLFIMLTGVFMPAALGDGPIAE